MKKGVSSPRPNVEAALLMAKTASRRLPFQSATLCVGMPSTPTGAATRAVRALARQASDRARVAGERTARAVCARAINRARAFTPLRARVEVRHQRRRRARLRTHTAQVCGAARRPLI
jgi:hypothetical protein